MDRTLLTGTDESLYMCTYIDGWGLKSIRTGSHAAQNIENRPGFPAQAPYCLSYPLPKHIFIKDYPISPRNFGEKLRKARIDAGLQIKELAQILGVSEDTVINWEVRGVAPTSRNLEKVRALVRRLGWDKAQ